MQNCNWKKKIKTNYLDTSDESLDKKVVGTKSDKLLQRKLSI